MAECIRSDGRRRNGSDVYSVDANGGCVQQSSTLVWLVVQDVRIQMTGKWTDPAAKLITTRALDESVRVKNDAVSLTRPGICT